MQDKDSVRRILLIGATFQTDNLGVGALTSGALRVLRKQYAAADIALLDYGVRGTLNSVEIGGETVNVPLVNLRFSWKIFLPNNIALLVFIAVILPLLPRTLQGWIVARNRWLSFIRSADLAIALSGGDSFSDIYGLERFFYVTLPQILVLRLGIRLVLFPQTLGPFRGMLARCVARYIMDGASVIYSRDAMGVSETRRMLRLGGSDNKVRFCFDLGFILEPIMPRFWIAEWPEGPAPGMVGRVGLNVSGLLLMGGYNKRNMFGLKLDYRDLVVRIIDLLVVECGRDVILIPHVKGVDAESDVTASRRLLAELGDRYTGRLSVLEGDYDQSEVKFVIGRCELFIGSRMHACIAALSQGVPTVAIAYSEKFRGVLESIGAGDLVADPRELSLDAILARIRDVCARRKEVSESLRRTMRSVSQSVLDLRMD